MVTKLAKTQTPEEHELERKRAELSSLESDLAQKELEYATLTTELHAFEYRYLSVVGVLYAELDRIEAEIADLHVKINPRDTEAQERVTSARAKAEESARSTSDALRQEKKKFVPSDEIKKLYREIAKRIHPDLTTDPKERERRTRLMAVANSAYEKGDEERLRAILRDWEASPEAIKGDGPGADLVRTIRKIAQVEKRLWFIESQFSVLKKAELYELKARVEEEELAGRDLLAIMAKDIENEIMDAKKRLRVVANRNRVDER